MPQKPHTASQHPATPGMALTTGLWAIDRRFPLESALQQLATGRELHAMSDDSDDAMKMALRDTDGFTTYVNPDGTEVSSLDGDMDTRIMPGAIAVVPIHGVMLKSCPNWYQFYGFTSTARATADVAKAAGDDRVKGIILNVYTPGGMVYGADALSQVVKDAASKKPTITHVSDLCASAGVFACAHSTAINLGSRTAEMGSIGTMTTVVNDDEYWHQMGIKWVTVFATDSTEKNAAYFEAADGKPEKLQAHLDAINAVFLGAVREGRGAKLSGDEALTGAMFVGQQAIEAGLADGYATLEETIALARTEADAADQVPDPNKEQRQQPQAMSFLTKLAALAISIKTALFADGAEAPTAEQLAQANSAFKAEGITGVQLVTDEQAAAAAQATALQEQLATAQARATELEAQLATAQEQHTTAQATLATLNTELEAIATEHNITAAEGSTVPATVVAMAKQWAAGTSATHTGSQKAAEGGAPKKYASIAAAEKDGIKMGTK
jgi:ClpP class serine protease